MQYFLCSSGNHTLFTEGLILVAGLGRVSVIVAAGIMVLSCRHREPPTAQLTLADDDVYLYSWKDTQAGGHLQHMLHSAFALRQLPRLESM